MLKEYQNKLEALIGENEKLKILSEFSPMPTGPKDKLGYGGKEGADAAIAFIDKHAKDRDQKIHLIREIQELKAKICTSTLLLEDKSMKLQVAMEKLKSLKLQSARD